jgi:toxin ParE1/3/4
MRIIKTRSSADRDIERGAVNIAEFAGVEAGLRFYEACDRAFLLLASQPGMGVVKDFGNPIFAGMRMWRLKGFEEYLIFYRPIQIKRPQTVPATLREIAATSRLCILRWAS